MGRLWKPKQLARVVVEGGTATFKAERFYDPFRTNSIRVCVEERQTSQWLGLSRLDVDSGEVVAGQGVRRLKEVRKRFRYPPDIAEPNDQELTEEHPNK